MSTILVTGVDGVLGSEVVRGLLPLAHEHEVVQVTRRGPESPGRVCWEIGAHPAPAELRRHWDTIVHMAASTRWTMTRTEAAAANVASTAAVLDLADADTHVVHVSTAYVGGHRSADSLVSEDFDGYRNGYEWSKARAEAVLAERHRGPHTVIRPPLIMGRRADGAIERFSGPYTLLRALVSGLAAVVVGDPEGYAEVAPVDDVARCVVRAALDGPDRVSTHVIAAGADSLRLGGLLSIACGTLNAFRQEHQIEPVAVPPIVPTSRWRRFYLPLARRELSEVQNRAVDLLGMFESYTSIAEPFEPTDRVADPAGVLARSVLWWARAKPRQACRIPEPWATVPG